MSSSLWTGPYGSIDEIRSRTHLFYNSIGFPDSASDLAVHPLLDEFVWEKLSSGTTKTPTDNLLQPVSGDPYSAERWCVHEHPADTALTSQLSEEALVQFEVEEEPKAPDEAFADRLSNAHSLLSETIPELWENTAPFVTRVFDVRSKHLNSASFDHIGGAILLNSSNTNDSSEDDLIGLAECLLHEAAHSKSYRIFRSFDRVKPPESPEFIDVPWWRVGGQKWEWDADRAIVASHVYSHLSAFYDRLKTTHPLLKHQQQRASFRAQFLTNVLVQLPREVVDDDWRNFIYWIASTIKPFGPLTAAIKYELSRPLSSFPGYTERCPK